MRKTEELNEREFQERVFQTALSKSIISNQFSLHNNEILKHTEYYKADIKRHGKPYNLALIRAEIKEFDKVDQVDGKRVSEIFESLDKVLNTLARSIFADWQEVDNILKAYAKDPKSMIGITNKILR